MVGSLGRIDQQHLRTGTLDDDDWAAADRGRRHAGRGADVHRRDAGAHARRTARARARAWRASTAARA
ncbi:MAG: hypothetical protein MZV65_14535 [Chromatiales bacterium]|nr:hypothetical protein [Chromatiales bacterium]